MRKIALFVMLSVASFAALADTVAFGNRVLTDGDSASRVRQVAGEPDRIEQIQNEKGAVTGERWEYLLEHKTVVFLIVDGKVKSIAEIH